MNKLALFLSFFLMALPLSQACAQIDHPVVGITTKRHTHHIVLDKKGHNVRSTHTYTRKEMRAAKQIARADYGRKAPVFKTWKPRGLQEREDAQKARVEARRAAQARAAAAAEASKPPEKADEAATAKTAIKTADTKPKDDSAAKKAPATPPKTTPASPATQTPKPAQ